MEQGSFGPQWDKKTRHQSKRMTGFSWLDVWGWCTMLRNPERILRPFWPIFKLWKFQIDLGGLPLLNQHKQHLLYNIYLWWVKSWSQDRFSQIMRDSPPLYYIWCDRINVSSFMGKINDQEQTSKLSITTHHTSIKLQLLQITHLRQITPIISRMVTYQSIKQSISQSTNQTIHQSINQPINQPTNQSTKHSINQPINQS